MAIAHYIFHISKFREMRLAEYPENSWLISYLPDTILGYYQNTVDLFGYLFLPEIAGPVLLMAIAGFAALIIKRQFEVIGIIVFTLLIHIFFTLLKLYPFGGCRHSLYLLPLMCVLTGSAVGFIYEKILGYLEGRDLERSRAWLDFSGFKSIVAALCVFVLVTILIAHNYQKSDYLRRKTGKSWVEFPVSMHSYNKTMNYLQDHAKPGDIILSDKQGIYYMYYEDGYSSHYAYPSLVCPTAELSGRLLEHSFRGIDVYFMSSPTDMTYNRSVKFREVTKSLRDKVRIDADTRIWIFSIGWNGLDKGIESDSYYRQKAREKVKVDGGVIYELTGKDILNEESYP